MKHRFHISLPCLHIGATENFYTKIIGASLGRKAPNWVDVNLFEHQITFTNSGKFNFDYPSYSFERTVLPSFHFGVILELEKWSELYTKLKKEDFLHIDKTTFLSNQSGAHQSFFLRDPNGYIIEFKCFDDAREVFEK